MQTSLRASTLLLLGSASALPVTASQTNRTARKLQATCADTTWAQHKERFCHRSQPWAYYHSLDDAKNACIDDPVCGAMVNWQCASDGTAGAGWYHKCDADDYRLVVADQTATPACTYDNECRLLQHGGTAPSQDCRSDAGILMAIHGETTDDCGGRTCTCNNGQMTCAGTKERKPYHLLVPTEKQRLLQAFKWLYSTCTSAGECGNFLQSSEPWTLQDATALHAELFRGLAHWNPAFLPWHRCYLCELETKLQLYHTCVTIPYWYHPKDAEASPDSYSVYDEAVFGNGTSWPALEPSSWFTITRDPHPRGSIAKVEDLASVLEPGDYDSFYLNLEQGIVHRSPHVNIGGAMRSGLSPQDPFFWMHHAMVDRIWAMWHAMHNTHSASAYSGPLDRNLNVKGEPITPRMVLDRTGVFATGAACDVSYLVEDAASSSFTFDRRRLFADRGSVTPMSTWLNFGAAPLRALVQKGGESGVSRFAGTQELSTSLSTAMECLIYTKAAEEGHSVLLPVSVTQRPEIQEFEALNPSLSSCTDASSLGLPDRMQAAVEFTGNAAAVKESLCKTSLASRQVTFDFDAVRNLDSLPGWTNGYHHNWGWWFSIPGEYKWTLQSGGTPSSGTGPSTGFGGSGNYLFTEASWPRRAGDKFRLSYDGSACDDRGQKRIASMSFAYHMKGEGMGSLQVWSGGRKVWERSGHQGDDWLQSQPFAIDGSFYFQAERGSSYASDVAVDHIIVTCAM